ncbi:MAG: heme o synthase [Bacteroidota bacterium]
MSNTAVQSKQAISWWSDFNALVKLRLSSTVVFSSVMAYLIALNGAVSLVNLLILASGGFFVTAAANILNEVLERDFDKLMKRTADRPLAAGRMDISNAVLIAGLMVLVGITLLALFNPATSLLGTFALVSYAFMYTPMKRVSTAAVTVGAIAGALPTLIGCVAAEGRVSLLGVSLFAIQFFWQYTHFWSIAYLGFEDYRQAGYQFLPQKNGKIGRTVGVQAFVFALALVPVAIVPYYLGETGLVSAAAVSVLSLVFAYFAWNFYQQFNRKSALRLMFSSFVYIPIALLIYYFDKL